MQILWSGSLTRTYTRDAFGQIAAPADIIGARLSDISSLPSMNQVRSLATWDADLLHKFERTAEDLTRDQVDRSGAMAEWSYLTAEAGWSDEQILASLYDLDDRWGKFVHRHNRQSLLVDLVNRARAKVGYSVTTFDAKAMIERLEATPATGPIKRVFGWGEFAALDIKIDWMIEGLLSQYGLGLVAGFPGVGKTQFCINLGRVIAAGANKFLQWHGPSTPKRVLLLSLEMAKEPLHHFIEQFNGDDRYDRGQLQQNFQIFAPGTPMPLDTKEGQDFLVSLLEEVHPDVVIFDSLQKIASKELTDETAVKSLVHFLALARDKYRCAMVVVHHHRKKSNDQQKRSGVELSDVYGSTYITTDVDFVLSLRKYNDDDSTVLIVETLKNRLAVETPTFNIRRREHLYFDVNDINLDGIQHHE